VTSVKSTTLLYNKFMNLPLLTEIEIHDFAVQALVRKLRDSEVGSKPCFIELEFKQRKYVEPALDNITAALEILEVDPRFPYPLYIITPLVRRFLDLAILNSRSQLPKHFYCKTHRLNSKEQSLLKKTKLLSSKIKNNELSEISIHIESHSNLQRLLSDVCQENDFLESVTEGLQRPLPKGERKI
jgi:hypothetical protein